MIDPSLVLDEKTLISDSDKADLNKFSKEEIDLSIMK